MGELGTDSRQAGGTEPPAIPSTATTHRFGELAKVFAGSLLLYYIKRTHTERDCGKSEVMANCSFKLNDDKVMNIILNVDREQK